ncbi:hypothetical protein IT417_01685 [bacterium]|nr:hypothetical protein [bacterium]
MVKGQKKLKLGRKASHKRALVRNLLRSLFTTGYLTTTTVKAKALRQEALRVLATLKVGGINNLRSVSVTLGTRELVEKVVKYLNENEAKIKVLKIGFRDGDMAQTSRVTLVGYNVKKEAKKAEKKADDKKEKTETKKSENRVADIVKNVGKNVRNVVTPKQRATSRSGL